MGLVGIRVNVSIHVETWTTADYILYDFFVGRSTPPQLCGNRFGDLADVGGSNFTLPSRASALSICGEKRHTEPIRYLCLVGKATKTEEELKLGLLNSGFQARERDIQ
eukprot:1187746-Prorocentrum_minimum.AAC.4